MKKGSKKVLLSVKVADKEPNTYTYLLFDVTIIERGTYGNGDN